MVEVSVVIPTYNRADLLPRAIDSVLAQTFSDLELLVVDDGSTDATETVVGQYEDARVTYLQHDTNRGANVARNTGIDEADGTYVAFLDSDDEWRPSKIERQLGRVESGDWVGAYCGFETRSAGVSHTFQAAVARLLALADDPVPHEGTDRLAAEILADNVHPGAGSTLLVRTDIATRIGGFDETLDRFQDPEFVLRVLESGPLAYIDQPLVIRHPTGSPAAETIRRADDQFLDKHESLVDDAEQRGFDVHGAHALILAKAYLAEGRLRAAAGHLDRAAIRPRHVPGVLWAAASGIRRRHRTLAVSLAFVGMIVTLYIARR